MEKQTTSNPEIKHPDGNLSAAFTYFLWWITGLIFLFLEKEDEFIRYNAALSVVVFGIISVLSVVLFPLAVLFLSLGVVLWVVLSYKAYNNERVELPFLTDLAKKVEEFSKKIDNEITSSEDSESE